MTSYHVRTPDSWLARRAYHTRKQLQEIVMPVSLICPICNGTFLRDPNEVRKGVAKYCSQVCSAKGRNTTVILQCQVCDKEFRKHPSEINRREGKFCSRECYRQSIKRNKTPPLQKLQKKTIYPSNGCWVWIGGLDRKGYGCVLVDGKTTSPHRLSWTLHHGPIPPELNVCHKCDNPPCWNPNHLFLGTQLENIRDAIAKNRFRYPGKENPQHSSRPGEQNSQAKLTVEKVEAIRKLRQQSPPVPMKKLAEQFGVHLATISDIVTRKTWAHLS